MSTQLGLLPTGALSFVATAASGLTSRAACTSPDAHDSRPRPGRRINKQGGGGGMSQVRRVRRGSGSGTSQVR